METTDTLIIGAGPAGLTTAYSLAKTGLLIDWQFNSLTMIVQFVIHNWYLFVALAVILFLLVMGPLSQHLHGIKNANAAQTVQLLNREDGVVVDVCEPKEFQAGHIPNAVNLPLSALSNRPRDEPRGIRPRRSECGRPGRAFH